MHILIIEQNNKTAKAIAEHFKNDETTIYISENPLEAHRIIQLFEPEFFICNADYFHQPLEDIRKHIRRNNYQSPLCFYSLTVRKKNTFEVWYEFNSWLWRIHGIPEKYIPYIKHLALYFRSDKNTATAAEKPEHIYIRDIFVDFKYKMVKKNGISIHLTEMTKEILCLFCMYPGEAFSIEQIEKIIWKGKSANKQNNIYVYINIIRKIIEANPKKPELLLRDGKGQYRLSI